jgi:hypothetical protein
VFLFRYKNDTESADIYDEDYISAGAFDVGTFLFNQN